MTLVDWRPVWPPSLADLEDRGQAQEVRRDHLRSWPDLSGQQRMLTWSLLETDWAPTARCEAALERVRRELTEGLQQWSFYQTGREILKTEM